MTSEDVVRLRLAREQARRDVRDAMRPALPEAVAAVERREQAERVRRWQRNLRALELEMRWPLVVTRPDLFVSPGFA